MKNRFAFLATGLVSAMLLAMTLVAPAFAQTTGDNVAVNNAEVGVTQVGKSGDVVVAGNKTVFKCAAVAANEGEADADADAEIENEDILALLLIVADSEQEAEAEAEAEVEQDAEAEVDCEGINAESGDVEQEANVEVNQENNQNSGLILVLPGEEDNGENGENGEG